MKLRIIAGTDVERPATSPVPTDCDPIGGDELLKLIEPLFEVFEIHKEAHANYRHAVDDLARRTGRSVTSIGHKLSGETRRRKRAAEQSIAAEPLEAIEWCGLM